MTKTENYNLNQWDPEDKVIRTDFNEDNAKIDAALAGKAEASELEKKADVSALAALKTAVNSKGNCVVEYGTYVGTGTYGNSDDVVVTLRLGYRPKLLFVKSSGDGAGIFVWPSTSATNLYSTGSGVSLSVTWLEDGLQWRLSTTGFNTASNQLNSAGTTYYYTAFH